MAYRRRQQPGFSRPLATSVDEHNGNPLLPPPSIPASASAFGDDGYSSSSSSSSSSSLAAKAIRASSAYRDSSLSSAYAGGGVSRGVGGGRGVPSSTTSTSSASRYPNPAVPSSSPPSLSKESKPYEYTSMKNLNESKHGFWGALARKAKSILDDDNEPQQLDSPGRTDVQVPAIATRGRYRGADQARESLPKTDNPALQKGLNALASSINYIGGTIGNALEEGITIVENRTAGIVHETQKHIRKKSGGSTVQNQAQNSQSQTQADLELQLKASRDVAMAMAAKAKLLLRELKTVKADFAFAKERCAQLEEENKILRENRERGDNPEDDDLIRLQLESLLAEKARLAHENSVYARENRFLREVVEYHQLTMQDVVYLDEGTEEVTEVYPIKVIPGNSSPSPEVRGVSHSAAQ
ncbi:uncharacterized protein LOC133788260 [Humulus lupulus]|uniref:uncharacterized protein LOC133788260 n=1 Tax=Humulus lupulus TaxID=3486 RepID=UPI002B414BC2|nr:uncharacterized protein LOC133788260 [Humulus lupulus]